jgi:hypothetical protein
VGNQIRVDTVDAAVLGFGIPTDLVSGVVKTMSQGLQSYPLNMHPTQLTITNTGLDVKMSGGAVTLQGDQNAPAPTTC